MSLARKYTWRNISQQFSSLSLVMVSLLVMPESGRARTRELKNESCFFWKAFLKAQVRTSKHSIFTLYILCFGKGVIKVIIDLTTLSDVLRYFQDSIALLLQLGAKKDQDFV